MVEKKIKSDPKKLTPKQERFVKFYVGNGTEAARKAGYSGSDDALGREANRLLSNAKIASLIRVRQEKENIPHILSRQDRQIFWSKVMADPEEDMKHRLKASEYLAKSECDFAIKLEHSGKITLEELVMGSMKKDE